MVVVVEEVCGVVGTDSSECSEALNLSGDAA